jgi:hypothetical protein
MTTTDENCLRRLAVQLAAQLPDSSADALVTIGYLRELVDFVAAPDSDKPQRLHTNNRRM